jgi:hypothetical protein
MADQNPGQLQIYEVEEADSRSATCVVRCVGGVVRPGQRFDAGSATEDPNATLQVTLEWINRYGRFVDFFDPPHNAKVYLTGDGVALLKAGLTITSTS